MELAEGRKWAEIEGTLPGVAEGAYTVDAALALAERLGVEMPIAQEVHDALYEGKSVQRCLHRPALPRVEGRAGGVRDVAA